MSELKLIGGCGRVCCSVTFCKILGSLADILNKTFFAHENGSVNGMFNIRLGGNERVLSFLGDHYGESYVPLKITTTGD